MTMKFIVYDDVDGVNVDDVDDIDDFDEVDDDDHESDEDDDRPWGSRSFGDPEKVRMETFQ